MNKLYIVVSLSLLSFSAQAKTTAEILIKNPDNKILRNCKVTSKQLLLDDLKYKIRLSSALIFFGGLKETDFDGLECLSKDSIIGGNILVVKLSQVNKSFLGQKIQAYVAYNIETDKTLALILDEKFDNYFSGYQNNDLLLAIENYMAKDNSAISFNSRSKLQFKDFGVSVADRQKEVDLLQAAKEKGLGYEISYDKFEKIYNIKSDEKDRNIIRAVIDANTKKIKFIQLYTSVGFGDDWGNIQSAIDIDSKRHKVTKIDIDTKCFGGGLRCYNTEILGIDLNLPFLEKYKDGFELKLVGKFEVVIKVSKESIAAFNKALNEANSKVIQ